MRKTEKIFRDPLYNYVSIDRESDGWLLELLDSSEVQRLRRIHQLGVSNFTYPGAEHSRLSHTLGVLHLMQQALDHIERLGHKEADVTRARHPLLAAALLHDVGHGPFSHLFEVPLGIDHESWSKQIICSEETKVNEILKRSDIAPQAVADLIEERNHARPPWQKCLLSSELDVDRLDYLRRDSVFTGSGYGHFDWYRILHTFDLHETPRGSRILVWPDKTKYAIEEYIFSRFYMYNNVYQHKTTRGFEKLLHAAWERAKQLHGDGTDVGLVGPIAEFWAAENPSVRQYLALEDCTVLYQLQVWSDHGDQVLGDLSRRFLRRERLAAIDDPELADPLSDDRTEWEEALKNLLPGKYDPPDYYALRDDLKLTIYNPYLPEKENREQNPYNAIFIQPCDGGEPVEISEVLDRLKVVTGKRPSRYRYYVPGDVHEEAKNLRDSRKW